MDLKLTDGKTIILNSQQEIAVETMDKWYQSPDLFFLLTGYAGTGKTTISKHFLEREARNGVPIVVTAPTHQAKRVVSQATGFEGKTLQSLLGLGLDTDVENFDPNDPTFAQVRPAEIALYKIVLVDESSMCNQALTDFLLDEAEENKTRVIFLCDGAQLPPVKEVISPVLTTDRIHWKAHLTQVERQAGDNPLMLIYDQMRDNLGSTKHHYPTTHQLNEKREGIFVFQNNVQFAQQMMGAFKLEGQRANFKVLCWRNDRRREWNRFLRAAMFGKEAPLLVQGEILKSYSNNGQGKIVNSGEYQIQKLTELQMNFDNEYDVFGKTLHIRTGIVPVWELQILDLAEQVRFVVHVVKPSHGMQMGQEASKFMKACSANRQLWSKYFTWRSRFYLMEEVLMPGARKPVLKQDFDYGYCITVHKAQGSTYDRVFIDDTDFQQNSKTVERNKLRYVALSRPRLTATVLTS